MNWTTEPNDAPGFYLWRTPGSKTSYRSSQPMLDWRPAGSAGEYWRGGEWFGPIPWFTDSEKADAHNLQRPLVDSNREGTRPAPERRGT